MSKHILIISSSPRKGGNSETLAASFAKGAAEAGNHVETIYLREKQYGFCKGCLACLKLGHCAIKDDAVEIAARMHDADVLVFATRSDIWGLVINEAMAQGLPVITTRQCVAGVELVEEGRNGFLVDAENVSELAERIRTLLSSPDLRRQFGERSYRKMMDYTIEKMAQRHFEILCNT